ncbi:MAG: cell division protein ZapA [Proteobacteria bacterium SW_6_67_9]|jgi:cell division protein ZapA|nr:MAG: cell division protein ZapA [Proteobacteria bacterium SW_6_67_9]
MADKSTVPVTIRILDRDYQVACRADEKEDLEAAAGIVDERMKEVRSRGSVIGTDRVAVMAALNMAHELLELRELKGSSTQARDRMSELEARVATTLSPDDK